MPVHTHRFVAILLLSAGLIACDKRAEPTAATPTAETKTKKPEPAEAKKHEPAEAKKPEPADAKKPEPADAKKPEPAEAKKHEPAEAKKPEPDDAKKPEPADAKKPEPATVPPKAAAVVIPAELDKPVPGVPPMPAGLATVGAKQLRKARIVRRKGVALMRKKKFAKAAQRFVEALAVDPSSESRNDLITAYALGGKPLEALQLMAGLRKLGCPICQVWLVGVQSHKRLATFRADARYVALMKGFSVPALDLAKLWDAFAVTPEAIDRILAARVAVYIAVSGKSVLVLNDASKKAGLALLRDEKRTWTHPDGPKCADFCCRDTERRSRYDEWDMNEGGSPQQVLRKVCWVPLPDGTAAANEIHVYNTWLPDEQ